MVGRRLLLIDLVGLVFVGKGGKGGGVGGWVDGRGWERRGDGWDWSVVKRGG